MLRSHRSVLLLLILHWLKRMVYYEASCVPTLCGRWALKKSPFYYWYYYRHDHCLCYIVNATWFLHLIWSCFKRPAVSFFSEFFYYVEACSISSLWICYNYLLCYCRYHWCSSGFSLSSSLLSWPILLELLLEDLTCQFPCTMKASKRLAAGKLHLSIMTDC